jgi:hypothetical protein
VLFAATRSHWLDDWDSVNFAFGLDDFDVIKHWPHPPGYPVYIGAGKLVYRVIADHAGRPCPGAPTPRGALVKRIACGLIAGLSLGARPHITLLIVLYWCFRAHRPFEVRHFLTAVLAFAVGIAAWLIPACSATGGPQIYWTATVSQFEWRLDRPGVSVLDAPITGDYLLARILMLIGSIGQAFAPMHLTEEHIARRGALGLLIIVPYAFFAWRGASKDVARLPHRFGDLSADAVRFASGAALALFSAAQSRRRLVGVRLPRAVPQAGGPRACVRGVGCVRRVAFALPGRRPE